MLCWSPIVLTDRFVCIYFRIMLLDKNYDVDVKRSGGISWTEFHKIAAIYI